MSTPASLTQKSHNYKSLDLSTLLAAVNSARKDQQYCASCKQVYIFILINWNIKLYVNNWFLTKYVLSVLNNEFDKKNGLTQKFDWIYLVNGPAHNILAHMVYVQKPSLSDHPDKSSGARSESSSISILCVCASNEGIDESAHSRRLVWDFAARQCNEQYRNRMC